MKNSINVYIFDNMYNVLEGELLHFNKKYGHVGERFIFFSEEGQSAVGTIVSSDDNKCSLGIIMVDSEIRVPKKKIETEDIIENKEIEIIEETKEVEEDKSFDSMTKKELIAYIKENKIPINTTKANKATILEALKCFR